MPNGFILAGTDITTNDIIIKYSADLSGSSYPNNANIIDSTNQPITLISNDIKEIKSHYGIWIILLIGRDTNTNSNVLYSTNGGSTWQSMNNIFLFSIDYGKIDGNDIDGWIALGYDNDAYIYKFNSDLTPYITNTTYNTNTISVSLTDNYGDPYMFSEIMSFVTIASDKSYLYAITSGDPVYNSEPVGFFLFDSSNDSFKTDPNNGSINSLVDYIYNQTINSTILDSYPYDTSLSVGDTRTYLKTISIPGSILLLINDINNGAQTGRIIFFNLYDIYTVKYASNNIANFNTSSFNVHFTDIATDGAGTIVAVGQSDRYQSLKGDPSYRDGLIVYSQDGGISWTEVIDNRTYVFIGITYQNGYWIATTSNNKTQDTLSGSQNVTYITNDLTNWTTNSEGVKNSNWTPVFQTMNISEIQGGSFDLQCLLKGTSISTPNGYVPIENLVVGDKVLMPCGEVKEITNVYVSHVFATDKTLPYIIPAGELGAIKDVYISPTHSVRASNGELIEAQFLGYKQANIEGIIEYYNISLGGNRNNMILADGVAVESMGKDLQKTVLDISSYPAARLFPDNIRNSHIVKLHKQYNIPIKVLQGYPDSYIQELISK